MRKRFFVIFSILIALTVAVTSLIYFLDTEHALEMIKTDEQAHIKLVLTVISPELKSTVADLLYLSDSGELMEFLENKERDRNPLQQEYFSMAYHKRAYDQIRLLDDSGMEIIRINFNNGDPIIVPDEELQFKGDRYYFSDTYQLNKGEVYISQLDLNIEHGEIEKPLKPIIRFGTPIFDKNGQKRGVIVLNYFGSILFQHIESIDKQSISDFMLINPDGYWLLSPKKEDEWGFMYPDRLDRTFGNVFPESWLRIKNNESGQFNTKDGIFTFTTFYPLREAWKSNTGSSKEEINTDANKANEYYWKIVIYTSPNLIKAQTEEIQRTFYLPVLGLIAIFGFISYQLANLQENRKQIELLQNARSKVLEQFSKTDTLDHIFNALIHYVKQIFPNHPVSILLLDEISQHLLYGASFGLPDFYNRAIDGLEIGPKVGSCGAAAYSAKRVVVDDIDTSPNWLPFLELAHKAGLRACWSEPIKSSTGKVLGTFAIYNTQPSIPGAKDLQLLEDISHLAGSVLERKQMEKALLESEEKFRSMASSAQYAIIMIDNNGRISFWNQAAEKIFGWSSQESIGKDVHVLLASKQYHAAAQKAFAEFRKTGQGAAIGKISELIGVRRNGEEFPVELAMSAVRLHGEWHAIGIITDITERKRTAQRYETILKTSIDSFWCCDAQGKILNVNDALCQMLGYDRKELLSMSISDIEAVETPEDTAEHIRKVIQQGSAHFDTRHKRKDGKIIDVEISTNYLNIEDGRFFVFARDITERKKVESELRNLLRAVEQSSAVIVITNRDGRIEYVNPRFEEHTGYTTQEALGNNLKVLKSGVHSLEFYKNLWDTILSGQVWRGELCNKKKNGELYWEYASIAPIRNESGEITHFVAVKEDITERKKMEEGLKNAKQVAEAANKAKSEFLANMSHELRTPLNAINGFSEVLLEKYFGDLNTKQEEYVRDILESGNHLLSLINDILDLSRVEAGKEVLELSQVNLQNLLENSLVMIKEKSIKHNIALEVKIPNNLTNFQIIADQRKLKQVMYNFLSNAVKFTSDGGKISIEALRQKNIIQVSVSDTGIGVPKEEKGKIFNEFYQVRNDQEAKPQGTGLGLSLVKRYIEMHGGRVWVESEGSGKGSKFSFTLPIKQNLPSK